MADNVAITAGSGTTIAADDVGAGVLVQRVKATWGPDGTANDTDVASGKSLPVQLRVADGTAWTYGSGAVAAGTPRVTLASDSAGVITTGTLGIGNESSQFLSVQGKSGMAPLTAVDRFIAAAFTTLTRPANTTAYAVSDSISDNATAGSVTALSATLSDVNDAPILISEVIVDTNDTGIGAATTTLRAYLYNSDPTANSGVGAGDNATFSNKRAGLIGTLSGSFVAMSDGGKARLVPDAGSFIIANPTSGAKTLFIQYQIIAGTPTPSANSTTLIGTLKGIQGRA